MIRTNAISLTLIALIVMPVHAMAVEPEDEIRALAIEFNDAYLQNDLDRYFDFYADDATLWFNSGRSTLSSYRDGWYKLIESGGKVQKNTVSDLRVQMSPGGDTAIATYIVEVETRNSRNEISKQSAHETDVWFRTESGWKITHVHYTSRASE